MSTFIVVATLTKRGSLALRDDPARLLAVNAQAERLGAKIVRQYRVVGLYDLVTFVEAPDNATAIQIAMEISSLGTARLQVFPTIAFERFAQSQIGRASCRERV